MRKKAVIKRFVSISFPNNTTLSLHQGDEYECDTEYEAPKVNHNPTESMVVLHRIGCAPFAVNKSFVELISVEEV